MPPLPPEPVLTRLRQGTVIPAHPLALTPERTLDERRQRALTRYYLAAGAGGVAVGVHTTQFSIRLKKHGLLEPVLALAAETIDAAAPKDPVIRIAGVVGKTAQAVREAELAADLGYHVALVSLGALQQASDRVLLNHVEAVASMLPVMGFYLQPAVGGRPLSYGFWRALCERIENLVAVKIAPFSRYATADVLRAVSDAGRAGEVALYTGNDDHIILDLLSTYRFGEDGKPVRMVGGLLGHWAIWTMKAVEHFAQCRRMATAQGAPLSRSMLMLAQQVTDANGAVFDAAHGFAGSIPGVHEVLRRQGLLRGTWCLDPRETLSPGQREEIDRVYTAYPRLNDDEFVREGLDEWLR